MSIQVDLRVFHELQQMTDPDFVQQLVDAFVEDVPIQVNSMRAALTARRPVDFQRAAHSVKSTAATFGASPLAELARELEQMGRESRLEQAVERLQELESLFRSTAAELKELCQ